MPPSVRAGVATPEFVATQELFRADGLTLSAGSDIVTANIVNQVTGKAGVIDVSPVGNGLLVVNVGGASGTTPSLSLFFDVQDAYGNWVPVSPSGGLTTTVAITGAGLFSGNISAGAVLTYNGRIRWTVTGTTPSFTGVSLNLFGR